jgi:hypothetical protein
MTYSHEFSPPSMRWSSITSGAPSQSLFQTGFGTLVEAFSDQSTVGSSRSSAITRRKLSRDPA